MCFGCAPFAVQHQVVLSTVAPSPAQVRMLHRLQRFLTFKAYDATYDGCEILTSLLITIPTNVSESGNSDTLVKRNVAGLFSSADSVGKHVV